MKHWIIGLLALLVIWITGSAAFDRPSSIERARALGNRFEESEVMQKLLEIDDDFEPIPLPGPHDWLTLHDEKGETFEEFRASRANRPDDTRKIIYLLPMGEFPEETSPPLEEIRVYAAAYFQMEVKVLPVLFPSELEFSPRKNPRSGQRQVLAPDILKFLQTKLPADAYCLLGVTMDDLYPQASWNYVFGMASLGERVGVYSFARYDEAFWGDERPSNYREIILRRSCKVLAHETGHMFGLPHCIYFDCVMNGSNHLVETDARTQQLCPVCLRKVHHSTGFDPIRRYRALGRFYYRQKWFEEFDWVNRQLVKAGEKEIAREN